uniref:Uncharacterized protein LOC116951440 n=1 Tax=Petromyzon marinus TaxID=7757 RepID=A0AAJ7TYJ4_PETMA|nr:uncharacterized protein LOC116951440 [Petromyzon marinus]
MAPKTMKKSGHKKAIKKKRSPTGAPDGEVASDRPEPAPDDARPEGSGKGTKKTKKRSRKGKVKLTKSERALAGLEKSCEAFERQPDSYREFLLSADHWLRRNGPLVARALRKIDDGAEGGAVSHADLKLALRNFGAPCDSVRLHVLTKLLDPDSTGSVDYRSLGAGLHVPGVPEPRDGEKHGWMERAESERAEEEDDDDEEDDDETDKEGQTDGHRLTVTKETLDRCPHCKMGVWKPRQVEDDRFVELEVRLVPFDGAASHPGHVKVLAGTGTTLHGLARSLRALAHTPSTAVRLYRPDDRPSAREPRDHVAATEAPRGPELVPLEDSPGLTLRELGVGFGSLNRPKSVRLCYDYALQSQKCPLLSCDYYFTGAFCAVRDEEGEPRGRSDEGHRSLSGARGEPPSYELGAVSVSHPHP